MTSEFLWLFSSHGSYFFFDHNDYLLKESSRSGPFIYFSPPPPTSLASCFARFSRFFFFFSRTIVLLSLSVLLPTSSSSTFVAILGLRPGLFSGWVSALPVTLEILCPSWCTEQLDSLACSSVVPLLVWTIILLWTVYFVVESHLLF